MRLLLDDGLSTTVELTGIGHQCLGLWQHVQDFTTADLANYRWMRHFPRQARRAAYLLVANTTPILSSYDVIHYINFYTPKTKSRAAKVVTIHDLWMFHQPEALPARYVPYIQKAVACSLQRADAVITPSYAVRDEILSAFPHTAPEKITVCFNGLREIFWRPPGANASQS